MAVSPADFRRFQHGCRFGALETALAARAIATGVEIRRGLSVEDLDLSDEEVTIRAGGGDLSRTLARRLRWRPQFGAPGCRFRIRRHRSRVHRLFGSSRDGRSGYAPPGPPLHADRHVYLRTARNDCYGRVRRGAFHRIQPITLDHVQAVLRRVSGHRRHPDGPHACHHLDGSRLPGDGLPQGACCSRATPRTSILRWAARGSTSGSVTHEPGMEAGRHHPGDAPAGLLDSYLSDRHPLGAQVLDWSRAQVALMRPSRSARALEAIIRDLIDTRDGATYFAERVWGVSLRYDLGDSHPLVGRSVPDFELLDGARIGELLRKGKGLFLDFDSSRAAAGAREPLEWSDHLRRKRRQGSAGPERRAGAPPMVSLPRPVMSPADDGEASQALRHVGSART